MKKSILSLLAVAAMVSCTQNDMDLKGSDEQVEIKLKSTALSIDAVVSRAPFDGEITASTNELTAKVMKSLTSGDYSATATGRVEGEMTFTDQGTTEVGFNTTPQFYPVDGSNVYLCGLYPVSGWTIGAAAATTAEIVIDGKTDAMAAKEVTTTKPEALASTYKTLEFKHLLTKLKIKAIADSASQATSDAAVAAWGKITKIELTEIVGATPNSKATVDMKAGTAIYGDRSGVKVYQMTGNDTYPATDVEFTGLTVDIPVLPTFPSTNVGAENVKDIAYSLIAPFTHDTNTPAKKDIKLTVYTENKTDGFPVSVDLTGIGTDSTVGKYCVVTLIFKATEIKAQATVTDWVAGGSADGTIE